jgi:hypothetical protein
VANKLQQKNCGRKSATGKVRNKKCSRKIVAGKVWQKNRNTKSVAEKSQQKNRGRKTMETKHYKKKKRYGSHMCSVELMNQVEVFPCKYVGFPLGILWLAVELI